MSQPTLNQLRLSLKLVWSTKWISDHQIRNFDDVFCEWGLQEAGIIGNLNIECNVPMAVSLNIWLKTFNALSSCPSSAGSIWRVDGSNKGKCGLGGGEGMEWHSCYAYDSFFRLPSKVIFLFNNRTVHCIFPSWPYMPIAGTLRLVKSGESISKISFDDLRKLSSLVNLCKSLLGLSVWYCHS